MNVENGQTVKEGDVVIIMEAMKMEVSFEFKYSYMKRVLMIRFVPFFRVN